MNDRHTLVMGCLLLLVACSCTSREPTVQTMQTPAPPNSMAPHILEHDDTVSLSWLQQHAEGGHTLQSSTLGPDGWSAVQDIHQSDLFFANWADRPSLLQLRDGTWVAHWLQKSGADTYAYDVRLSHSADGSQWSESITPHDDGTQTEHGFVSLLADGTDGVLAVWLDGRDYAQHDHDHAEMSLRAARWSPQGITQEAVLDTRTCDCCPTSMVRTSRGVLVAYRDRGPDETRDISLVRWHDGAWSDPWPLHKDGWVIQGCPVNGPELAAEGERVVAAWFTQAPHTMVQMAFSNDAGHTFPTVVRIDEGEAAGRVDVMWLPDGNAFVMWLESPPEGEATFRGRVVAPDGSLEASIVVATTDGSRAAGMPRVGRAGNRLVATWTTTDTPSQVRVAILENLW